MAGTIGENRLGEAGLGDADLLLNAAREREVGGVPCGRADANEMLLKDLRELAR